VNNMSRLWNTLKNLLRRDDMDRDLDSEVRSYAELLEEEKMRQGMDPSIAHRAARMEVGGPEQLKEEVRGARAGFWLEIFLKDLQYGARTLRKNPAFTVIAILTLALGIGANTAVFSIVNSSVFHPLPYRDSDKFVDIHTITSAFPEFQLGLSWLAVGQVREQVSAFDRVIAYSEDNEALTGQGDPAQLRTVSVSDGFFDEFAQTPELGRLLVKEDQAEGHTQVVVLSAALWRTRFGSDKNILGRTFVLSKKPYQVVGVASKGFAFPEDAELWAPLALEKEARQSPTWFMLRTVGRLRPGMTLSQAQSQLDTIADRMTKQYPEWKGGFKFPAISLIENRVQNIKSAYLMLLAASSLVLLIASANMASLLLSRGWARQRELAVRTALGASRGRILRQMLTESCLLALLGAAAGLVLAAGGVKLFRLVAPDETPGLGAISINLTMLWFALTSALVAGLACGIAPALRAARLDPNSAMHGGSSGARSSTGALHQLRLGNVLVVAEVSLAFLLLIGSVLTVKDLVTLLRVDPGFRTDHVLTLDISMDDTDSDEVAAREEEDLSEILSRVGQLPGVKAVSATTNAVMTGRMLLHSHLRFEDELPPDQRAKGTSHAQIVSPGYFKMLGVQLLRGREFTEHDVHGAQRVAIVNESLAKGHWGSLDVIGKRMSVSVDDKGNPEWNVIVGVIADTRDINIGSRPSAEYYLSLFQYGGSHHIMVRTAGNPLALAGAVTHTISAVLPDQPVTHILTLDQTISRSVGQPRMHAVLLGLFAGIGLSLALLGVYGVVSYTVIRRTREIGIRAALGAQRSRILGMVMWQVLALGAIGVAIGTGGGIALSKVIESQLSILKATDPATYIGTAVLMIGVACLACYIPARRAMRVDPMVALRHE
jgi:putative ABC transport system permease protein